MSDSKGLQIAAAEGFAAGARAYAAGRPEYPIEIEDWLRADLGLAAGRSVLDLGAGTGKLLSPCARPARRFSPSNPSRKCAPRSSRQTPMPSRSLGPPRASRSPP